MKKILFSLVALTLSFTVVSKDFKELITKDATTNNSTARIDNSALEVKVPKYIFSGLNTNIELAFNNPNDPKLVENNYELFFIVNGTDVKVNFNKNGIGTFAYSFTDSNKLTIYFENFSYSETLHIIPLWYILTPVGLLVLFLAYKLVRSGKKNMAIDREAASSKMSTEKDSAQSKQNLKKEQIKIKDVVEKEEEIFS